MTTATLPGGAPPAVAPRVALRGGPGYWLAGYRTMVRWHLASLRMWLMLLVMVQVLVGVGFVLGIGLFFDEVPPVAATYATTGAPVFNLVLLGLLLGPQLVADQRTSGGYDFLQSLPVPTTAAAAAWYTVTLVAGGKSYEVEGQRFRPTFALGADATGEPALTMDAVVV